MPRSEESKSKKVMVSFEMNKRDADYMKEKAKGEGRTRSDVLRYLSTKYLYEKK